MSNLKPIEYFYLIIAIIGGVSFLIRLIFSFFGGGDADIGDEINVEVSNTHSIDVGNDAHPAHAAESGFRLFSLQGITGFFMMFGLVGLALARGGVNDLLTAIAGLAAGSITMLLTAWLFYTFTRLQSEGTLRMENAIGKEGNVYLTIPENGSGQVSLVVQGALRQFEAISANHQRISTGQKIRVIRVTGTSTLVVEPLE